MSSSPLLPFCSPDIYKRWEEKRRSGGKRGAVDRTGRWNSKPFLSKLKRQILCQGIWALLSQIITFISQLMGSTSLSWSMDRMHSRRTQWTKPCVVQQTHILCPDLLDSTSKVFDKYAELKDCPRNAVASAIHYEGSKPPGRKSRWKAREDLSPVRFGNRR